MGAHSELNVDAREFRRVLLDAKHFDKKLYSGLRAELRKAGEVAVKDVKKAALKAPANHAGRTRTMSTTKATKRRPATKIHRGLRQSIASGVKVTIKAGKSSQVGVYIESTGGGDPGAKILKRKWDSPTGWRHPVFARGRKSVSLRDARKHAKEGTNADQKTVWVDQFGSPYFLEVLEKHEPKMSAAVRVALDKAIHTMEHRK